MQYAPDVLCPPGWLNGQSHWGQSGLSWTAFMIACAVVFSACTCPMYSLGKSRLARTVTRACLQSHEHLHQITYILGTAAGAQQLSEPEPGTGEA